MPKLIVAVDDEEDILKALSITLIKEGYNFKGFTSFSKLPDFLKKNTPDLFILDIMIPGVNGLDIYKELRKNARFEYTPIMFLSAKSDEVDKVVGLELGADDYITKPFSLKELSSRIKGIFRRIGNVDQKNDKTVVKGIKINKEGLEVFVDNKKTELTFAEFKILELLLNNKNKVFSRDEILDHLWGDNKLVTDRTVDFHIKNLREKIGKYGDKIKNARGVGYKFED
ncbi:response regulator transcription factor [Endomicrobium proavitum]|uniref:Alkaline phosphatase synthesis transcriptional regulatory proteinphoP n=1 Tax=Endomicrobium proavitum TaxID=1408281 RepID=A0A0G3WIB1_9BACT|nr:response regulator transcription factor [Endomicrobium proavitum]AKL98421.1 alkaline phosphatase synthesis transcriptional regulatory proteinphoP [Endomicrobium proavitum]